MMIIRHRRRDEDGLALISAILVTMVVTMLSITAVQLSLHNLNGTATDRKRVQAVDAAEAGIDTTLQSMQTTSSLPCTAASGLGTGPTQSSYSANVTYYDSTGASLSCSAVQAGTVTPATAEITSTGTTNANIYGDRTMHALVKLTPSPGGFDKALFANGTLTLNSSTTIDGNGGDNANVYSNSSFTCTNTAVFHGNLYVQGNITASNSCGGYGDWWAKGSISNSGSGTIQGNVYAAGDGSSGNISMGNGTVTKSATAKGTISPTPCGPGQKIQGTCSANANPGPGDPPVEQFPVWDWTSTIQAAWSAAGYTNLIDDRGTCTSTVSTKLYADLAAMANTTSTVPTVILTDCQIDWGKQNNWNFNTDLLVVTTGGMDTSNQVNFQSTTSTQHNFYTMVPYHLWDGSTPTTCGAYPDGVGNIAFKNKTMVSTLANLMYTPCGVKFTNSQTQVGQIYGGGQVEIDNNFIMSFQPLTVPGGVINGGAPGTGWTVALEYKREG